MEHTTKKTSSLSVVISIVILLIISWFAIRPLTIAGFFPMHDDTQVARVVVMGRAIAQGQLPVRWVSDLGYGYGYPIYNFYGPLPYYVGAAFTHIGFSGLAATKLMFGIGIVLLGLSTFALVASFWGPYAGLTAGTLALFAPYHAVQIYVRGAVGEFWASAFVPFILLGFLLGGSLKSRRLGILVGSIGLSAVILSHTLTGFVAVIGCLVFMGGYIAYVTFKRLPRDKEVLLAYGTIILVGLGLAAFFWLPAITEMRFTSVAGQIGATASFKDHFVCLFQFWNSPWGYGGSIPGCVDGLSFKLGKIYILLGLLGLLLWNRTKKYAHIALLQVGTLLVIGGVVFATAISSSIWSALPQFAYIQYPWRFITIIELGLAILVSSLVLQKSRFISAGIATSIILVVIWNNAQLFAPRYNYPRADSAFETQEELRFRVSKISDEYLPLGLPRPLEASNVLFDTIEATKGAIITKVQDEATKSVYKISSEQGVDIRINKAYFPGWRYWVNDVEVYPKITHGLPEIALPAGQSVVTMRFVDTPIRTVGNALTIIFVVMLFVYYGKPKKTIT